MLPIISDPLDLSGEPSTDRKCYAGLKDRLCATKEFIEKNKLLLNPLSRPEGLIKKATDVKLAEHEPYGMEVLLHYLPFEVAKEYMTVESKEPYLNKVAEWQQITDVQECAQDFLDYMNFAWQKAYDGRAISATRSIHKLATWLWLLGREDIGMHLYEEDLFNPYGAPALIKVCEEMGILVPLEFREFANRKLSDKGNNIFREQFLA